jgi:NAD(P)H-quinone oxidoreductase subunit 4L
MLTLNHFLVLAAALFCIGFYGVASKKNAVAVFMGIELMLNSVNINLVAFDKYLTLGSSIGSIFAILVIVVAAAEIAVGLAIIISLYRHRKSSSVDDLDWLKW